jgi:hypothetical protein
LERGGSDDDDLLLLEDAWVASAILRRYERRRATFSFVATVEEGNVDGKESRRGFEPPQLASGMFWISFSLFGRSTREKERNESECLLLSKMWKTL